MTDIMPTPGLPGGPCDARDCPHIDCADQRLIAETICPLCGVEIGYNCPFEDDTDQGLVHTACRDSAVNRLAIGVPVAL